MAIVATQALEILVSGAAVMGMRMRVRVVVAIAGAVVQTVGVAAAVAHVGWMIPILVLKLLKLVLVCK